MAAQTSKLLILLATACSPPVTVAASGTESGSTTPQGGPDGTPPDPTATSWGTGESTGGPTNEPLDDDSDSDTTTDTPTEDTSTGDPPTYCEVTDCDDNDPCTADTCNETTTSCEHTITPDEPCDDGNECTSEDVCQPDGVCLGDPSCPIEHCGEIDTDEVWGPELVHLLTCPVFVRGPATPVLTILDGTTVLAAVTEPVALIIGGNEPGRVEILGSERGVLFSSAAKVPAPGDWGGLLITPGSDESVIEGVTIEYAGVLGQPALQIVTAQVVVDSTFRNCENEGIIAYSADVEVYGSTITNNGADGVVLQDGTLEMRDSSVINNDGDGLVFNAGASMAGAEPSFTDNIVTQNTGAPMRLSADLARQLAGSSSYTGNGDAVVIDGGGDDCGTWHALDEVYRLEGYVSIESWIEPMFEIEAGARIHIDGGTLAIDGPMLSAHGTVGAPIEFLGGSLWLFGPWENLHELSNVVVDGGGVALFGSRAQLVDSEVRNHDGVGVDAGGGELQMSGTIVEHNTGTGVHATYMLAAPFTDNVITGNGFAMEISGSGLAALEADNTIMGNDLDVVGVNGPVRSAVSMPDMGVPYRLGSTFQIADLPSGAGPTGPAILTIEPGVIIELNPESVIEVGAFDPLQVPPERPGGLVAVGTADAPIIFRSAATPPAAGDWRGILFQPYALPSVLDHVVIQHAGYQTQGAIVTHTDDVTITNSEISDTDGWGIYNGDGTATQSGNTFMNNSSGDVSP